MSSDKLVYMANQIGAFFNHQEESAAVAAIAHHIKSFWDPRMRAKILEHEKAGGAGLQPRVLQAIRTLQTT
ncbi:MAG: formate dehydrogenase subunit delta [Rhodospirillaceae bacterium]